MTTRIYGSIQTFSTWEANKILTRQKNKDHQGPYSTNSTISAVASWAERGPSAGGAGYRCGVDLLRRAAPGAWAEDVAEADGNPRRRIGRLRRRGSKRSERPKRGVEQGAACGSHGVRSYCKTGERCQGQRLGAHAAVPGTPWTTVGHRTSAHA